MKVSESIHCLFSSVLSYSGFHVEGYYILQLKNFSDFLKCEEAIASVWVVF